MRLLKNEFESNFSEARDFQQIIKYCLTRLKSILQNNQVLLELILNSNIKSVLTSSIYGNRYYSLFDLMYGKY